MVKKGGGWGGRNVLMQRGCISKQFMALKTFPFILPERLQDTLSMCMHLIDGNKLLSTMACQIP